VKTDKIDFYILNNAKYFPVESLPLIREKLEGMSEDGVMMLSAVRLQDPVVMLIVSLFLGCFGVDRFLLGDIVFGLIKLFTGGVCGVFTIIDWFTVMRRTRDKNLAAVLLAI
jgi:TM2 domain-containing membrane protein YozV